MAKMMQLKEDPELKPIFDDIEANGAAAMEKYWNDTELMSKISQKMSSMNLGPATPPRKQDNVKVTHRAHKLHKFLAASRSVTQRDVWPVELLKQQLLQKRMYS